MSKPLPPLAKVASIVKRNIFHQGGAPGTNYVLLPVPAPGAQGVRITILLAHADEPNERGALSWKPPSHAVDWRADSGSFLELRRIAPDQLGIKDDPTQLLAAFEPSPTFGDSRSRLVALYDDILPAYAAGPRAMVSPQTKRWAVEMKALWQDAAEVPLLSYYRAVGKHFFAWLDQRAS